jgi:hypothetical protein
MKRLKGMVFFITFLVMSLSFHFEGRGASEAMIQFGIPTDMWTVLFLIGAVLVGIQTILKQRWNFITFTPYFMYTTAVVSLRLGGAIGTAWSSVAIIATLSTVMLIDLMYDWG